MFLPDELRSVFAGIIGVTLTRDIVAGIGTLAPKSGFSASNASSFRFMHHAARWRVDHDVVRHRKCANVVRVGQVHAGLQGQFGNCLKTQVHGC
jgi:hypothetical protein